ncbi:hypothetical protein DFJ77DRAFT_508710 [Powellomyces hirtus]|nr:hypothetical protein DFJ77DRAFT_508710 [Powellomyces hirtus]
MSWQPPPVGRQTSFSSANSKKTDLDLGFDDADLDDLLMSSSTDDDAVTNDTKKSMVRAAFTSISRAILKFTTAIPAIATADSEASQPKVSVASPGIPDLSITNLGIGLQSGQPQVQPEPVMPSFAKPSTFKNTVEDILKGLDDFDDVPPKPAPSPAIQNIKPFVRPNPAEAKSAESSGGNNVEDILKGLDSYDDDSFGAKKAFVTTPTAGLRETDFDILPAKDSGERAGEARGSVLQNAGNVSPEKLKGGTGIPFLSTGQTKSTGDPPAKPLLPWEKRAAGDGENAVFKGLRTDMELFPRSQIPTVARSTPSSSLPKPLLPWEKPTTRLHKEESRPVTPRSGVAGNPLPRSRTQSVSKHSQPLMLQDTSDDFLDMLGLNERPSPERNKSIGSSNSGPDPSPTRFIEPAYMSNAGNAGLRGNFPQANKALPNVDAASDRERDDFVPSFLLESSGPRRSRRQGNESTSHTLVIPAPASPNLPFLDLPPKPLQEKVFTKITGTPKNFPTVAPQTNKISSTIPQKPAQSGAIPDQEKPATKPVTTTMAAPKVKIGDQAKVTTGAMRVPVSASLSSLASLEMEDDEDEGSAEPSAHDSEPNDEEDESDVQDISLIESDLVLSSESGSSSGHHKVITRPARAKETQSMVVSNKLKLPPKTEASCDLRMKIAAVEAENAKLKTEMLEKEIAGVLSAQKDEIAKCAESQTAVIEALKLTHAEALVTLNQNNEKLNLRLNEKDAAVRELEQKLETRAREFDQERERSFQDHEKQILDLHERLLNQQKELNDERNKIQGLLGTLQSTLRDSHAQSDTERRELVEERVRIVAQVNELQCEKDTWLAQHQQDRTSFLKERAEFGLERKRILEQLNDERRHLAMEKAEVEARKHAVEQLECEIGLKESRTIAQLEADQQQHNHMRAALHASQNSVHHQLATLRAEKLTLDAQKAQLNLERVAFEAERDAAEKVVKEVMGVGADAATDRQKAHELEATAKESQSQIAAALTELKQQQVNLSQANKTFYDERIALSHERQRVYEDRHSEAPPRPQHHASYVLSTHLMNKDDKSPLDSDAFKAAYPAATQKSYNYEPLFSPSNHRDHHSQEGANGLDRNAIVSNSTPQDLFRKLNRFIGGLKLSETALDTQVSYLTSPAGTYRQSIPRVGWA